MSAIGELYGIVIGLGSIGNRHMRTLATRVEKLAVVRRERANKQFQALDGVEVFHGIEVAIESKPNFAVICNPSHLHIGTATRLLSADVPCLIEKPLGQRHDAAVEQFANANAMPRCVAAKKSAMAYCMRYHGAYSTAQRMLESNQIGRTLYAKAWFEGFLPAWHPWEDYRSSYAARVDSAGGALATLDHEIDFLNWTLGPATVSTGMIANSGAIGIEADDLAMVTSRHRGNVQSQATLSLCRNPPSRGFEFVGDKGTIRFVMESGELTTSDTDGSITEVAKFSAVDIDTMYVEMIDDYLRLIAGEQTTGSLATIADGLAAIRVIDGVTKSMPHGNAGTK